MDILKPIAFPVRGRKSYLVEFEKEGSLYGMYVMAINELDAKNQVYHHEGENIEIIKVKEGSPLEN